MFFFFALFFLLQNLNVVNSYWLVANCFPALAKGWTEEQIKSYLSRSNHAQAVQGGSILPHNQTGTAAAKSATIWQKIWAGARCFVVLLLSIVCAPDLKFSTKIPFRQQCRRCLADGVRAVGLVHRKRFSDDRLALGLLSTEPNEAHSLCRRRCDGQLSPDGR